MVKRSDHLSLKWPRKSLTRDDMIQERLLVRALAKMLIFLDQNQISSPPVHPVQAPHLVYSKQSISVSVKASLCAMCETDNCSLDSPRILSVRKRLRFCKNNIMGL